MGYAGANLPWDASNLRVRLNTNVTSTAGEAESVGSSHGESVSHKTSRQKNHPAILMSHFKKNQMGSRKERTYVVVLE